MLAGDRIQSGNLLNHLLTGDAPLLQGARQQTCQPVGLERQIAQDVDPALCVRVKGGNFHPGNDGNPVALSQYLCAGSACQCVVVGDGKRIQTGTFCIKDDVLQRGGAVGKFAVAMQIAYHGVQSLLTKRMRTLACPKQKDPSSRQRIGNRRYSLLYTKMPPVSILISGQAGFTAGFSNGNR